MTFKIMHAYHVMINYHKMDGVSHLLVREEEQCHEDLGKNYAKKATFGRIMQNEAEAGSRKSPDINFLHEL